MKVARRCGGERRKKSHIKASPVFVRYGGAVFYMALLSMFLRP